MSSRNKRNRNSGKKGRRNRSRGSMLMPNGVISDQKMPWPMVVRNTRTTTMQFSNAFPCLSDGAGKIASYISFDPSSTTSAYFGSQALFTEWSGYSAMWNEVRVRQFEVSLCRTYIDETKGDNYYPLVFSSQASPILNAPTNYQSVADNGDAQMWPVLSDQSGCSRFISVKMRQLAWATVTSPNGGSSSGIAAGCPGSILFYAAGFPTSVNIAFVRVRGLYQFRTRV